MIFKGSKLTKKEYTIRVAKRLAKRANVRANKKHFDRAEQMVKDGAYDDYVKTLKKPKKASEDLG